MAVSIGKVIPIAENSKFSYLGDGSGASAFFRMLNRNIYDGICPKTDYEGFDVSIHYTFESSTTAQENLITEKLSETEVKIVVCSETAAPDQIYSERNLQSVFLFGNQFSDFIKYLQELIGNSDKEVSYGLDDLIGYDYNNLFDQITGSKDNRIEISSWQHAQGMLKLIYLNNCFSSISKYIYDKLGSKDLIFDSIQDLIKKAVPEGYFESLLPQINDRFKSEQKADFFKFKEIGEAKLDELVAFFSSIEKYLPSSQFLYELFWSYLNKQLKLHKKLFKLLQRISKAKSDFESNLVASMGKESIELIFGKEGKKLLSPGKKYVEMMIGGGLFGAIPFLIGTIYQIIFDIINLIINLLWYGYKASESLLKWLLKKPESTDEDKIVADNSLVELFTMGFSLESLIKEDLPAVIKSTVSMAVRLINNFLDNAAEYGTWVGKMIAKGAIKVGQGLLNLITKSYPKKPTLIKRFIWIIKQWFNIGCLLGPLLVDIILMFCSGGLTGVFSAAVKLGKADKVYDGIRFLKSSKKLIESSDFLLKLKKYIPNSLATKLDDILIKVWAVMGKIQDQIKIIIKATVDMMPKGKKLNDQQMMALANKIDNWYGIASIIDLFAALIFILIGGENTKVNPKGKVVSV